MNKILINILKRHNNSTQLKDFLINCLIHHNYIILRKWERYARFVLKSGIDYYKLNLTHLAKNPHREAFEILSRMVFLPNSIYRNHLLNNPNNNAVNFFKDDYTETDFLYTNTNENAVDYVLNHILNHNIPLYNLKDLAKNTNDRVVNYIVNLFLNNFNFSYINIRNEISQNPNDIMVNFLLNSQQFINYPSFNLNTNDAAVNHLINNYPGFIDWRFFPKNNNDIAVKYTLNHLRLFTQISWVNFSSNSNNLAVKYLIAHPDKINTSSFSSNKNPVAVEYLVENFYSQIDWEKLSSNPGIFMGTRLWKNKVLPIVKFLGLHQRAVISANHPLRKLARGEFDSDYESD